MEHLRSLATPLAPRPKPPAAKGTLWRRAAPLALLSAACVLGPCPRSAADPRWFWDDRPVGSNAPVSDVDIAVLAEQGLPLIVFVAWVEPPVAFEGGLYLSASFDGGCTFCPPVHLESLFGPDDDIAIATAPQLRSFLPTAAVAVVHASQGRVQVLHDAVSINLGVGEPTCAMLQEMNGRVVRTELAADSADQPDIAAVVDPVTGLPHFHASWRQIAPTDENQIHHARDVSFDGTAWTVLSPLPGWPPPGQSLASPKISLDLRADGQVGVNLLFAQPEFNTILAQRSVDAGDTFSATGAPPEGPPALVAQGGLGNSGPLALDSGSSGDPNDPPWHGVLFFQDIGPARRLVLDAQHQRDPTVPAPSWGPEQGVTPTGALSDQGLAISVLPGGRDGEPQPTWLFWTSPDAMGLGPAELAVRGAVLDSDAATPVDVNAPAFPPVRPGDPSVSTAGPLTHCSIDPVTGACVPDRVAGGASQPASADGLGDVFVAWIDDRDGTPAAWFKRTDREVAAPRPVLEVACLSATERRITVSFDQLPRCASAPSAPERIERYLVYYGRDPAGPYDNTDLEGSDPGVPDTFVVTDDGSLVDPVVLTIDGLAAGVTYHVIVVPEDEARNVFPADFDPVADGSVAPQNETSIATPVDCGPCAPFVWGGAVTATPGDCVIELSWPAATGVAPVVYDLLRDGVPVATGLDVLNWTDFDVTWGTSYRYAARASDSCIDPGPREETTPQTAALGPDDQTAPEIDSPTLSRVDACRVRIEALVADACSGVNGLVDVWRDGLLVATGVSLPHDDLVPSDGSYEYELRGSDAAGNEGVSPPSSLLVSGCTVAGPCLFRATAANLDIASARALFISPRAASDIAFGAPNELAYGPCPFASGEPDPEPVLDPGSPPLIFYQVDGAARSIRLTKDLAIGSVRVSY